MTLYDPPTIPIRIIKPQTDPIPIQASRRPWPRHFRTWLELALLTLQANIANPKWHAHDHNTQPGKLIRNTKTGQTYQTWNHTCTICGHTRTTYTTR